VLLLLVVAGAAALELGINLAVVVAGNEKPADGAAVVKEDADTSVKACCACPGGGTDSTTGVAKKKITRCNAPPLLLLPRLLPMLSEHGFRRFHDCDSFLH
jgi:hypothetical protein